MSEKCCPNCGHCPTCGRSDLSPRPWPVYPGARPIWVDPTVYQPTVAPVDRWRYYQNICTSDTTSADPRAFKTSTTSTYVIN